MDATSLAEGERPDVAPFRASVPSISLASCHWSRALRGMHGVYAMIFNRTAAHTAAMAGGVLAAASAYAAPPEAVGGPSEVIVTATRIPTPVDQVLAPTIVIDRATLERSAAGDATDLLRFNAGIDIARNGGPGQSTSIFIRGAESNHTLVLIDGVRINPGTIGLAAIQDMPPDMIERIEVVKGPRSALWGTDAIGGVINIITRRGSREGWAFEAGYGDYDTRKASLNGGFGLTDAVGIDLGVSWTDSAGFPTRSFDRVNRGFDNLSVKAAMHADLGTADLTVRHWQATGTTQYTDFFMQPVDQDFATRTTAADLAFPLGEHATGQVTLSHLEDRIEQNQSSDYLRTRRDTADLRFDWRAGSIHTLGLGAIYWQEQAGSSDFGSVMRADTYSASVYAQDQISSGPHLATLALRYTDHETAGTAVTWNAEYGYAVSDATRVYALAGTGFRAPDATDRYGYGGNPDLTAERSRNYEIGVRHLPSPQQKIELSAFRTEIRDLIDFVVLDYETFEGINRNIASARIEGVEAAWSYAGGPWQARVSAIYQDPRNLDDDSRLLRRAKESLSVSLARTLGSVVLGFDVLASGDRKDFGFPKPVTLAGYVLANLTARWQVMPSLALVGRVENLLDEKYELANDYNTPRRGVYMAVQYSPQRGK